jgi:hypothetical protein
MYRSAAGDRFAGGGGRPPQHRRSYLDPRRRPVLGGTTQPLLGGLAEEIGVMSSGDLLMRLRKHPTHKTAGRPLLFPE